MKAKWIIRWGAAAALLVTLFTLIPILSENSQPDYRRVFAKTDVMIAMRDGVRLHTEIYSPKDTTTPLPILIERTPYGIHEDPRGYTTKLNIYQDLIASGYIFVFQDIRGRYRSEGKFVMNRPPRDPHDLRAVDESTDTYDTIDWLIRHVPNNNGKVGILGISYGGWLTVMAAIDPHPALRAASEQASPADMFLGDDFHHNGAFRLSYGFEYAALMETSKENFYFAFDLYDTFPWYLRMGPLSNANRLYFHGNLPTWNDFVNHPNYDSFWQKQAVWPYLKAVKVPMLNVAGWWDQEDFYGPVKIYETLEQHDARHWNFLAVGPWNHGGWAAGGGRRLGPVDFASNTAAYFRKNIQAPWFAYWLKDKGKLQAEAVTFETGSNQWQSFNAWPPRRGVTDRSLYFRDDGRLSFQPPPAEGKATDATAYDSYLSDPRYPVPYRPRPIEPTYPDGGWPTWLVQDQRFVHLRPDVATWETPPLHHTLTVAGDIVAHLYASTTGSDSDWIAKLIDVYPQDYPPAPRMGGYQLMIADEVFRGRFRQSFEKPQPIPPNQVEEYAIDLHTNDHAFLKGHSIMVQVQSTWFPLIDRNPQKFVPNIFKADASDYQEATQRIYRSPQYPSHIELPMLANDVNRPIRR
ncbi:MAG: CocE/NonD family hydrolase [Terriglobia bacterium]